MILIGEGKIHADNLPDAFYYTANRIAIIKSLFIDTSHGIRFTPVILETIKKSHKTLSYILRNQYKNADAIYQKVIAISDDAVLNREESRFCFSIIKRLQECPELPAYYKDVCDNIITPVFKRFGYYSPTMTFVIFIGLICFMGETYSSQYYGLVWKHFVKDGYPHAKVLEGMSLLDAHEKMMVRDETNTWRNIKRMPPP